MLRDFVAAAGGWQVADPAASRLLKPSRIAGFPRFEREARAAGVRERGCVEM